MTQSRGAKSSADDLGAGRGVVLSRAATTLRSIETLPSTGGFVTRLPYAGTLLSRRLLPVLDLPFFLSLSLSLLPVL
jgi:hypothetical protein